MQQMCALDYEPMERQRLERMALLRDLLIHAYRETDLYRAKLDERGIEPIQVAYPNVFVQVPITSKGDLRDEFPGRQLARSHRHGWLRYSNTSGSTGHPLMLIQDVDDISQKYASILRSRHMLSVDPMGSQARITPNECQPCGPTGSQVRWSDAMRPNNRKQASLFSFLEKQVINPWFHRRHMLKPFWDGNKATLPVDFEAVFDRLDRIQPEILTLYPLYALLLARYLERSGRTPPRIGGILEFSGGLTTPNMHEYIGRQFRVRTAQSSGGCEFARYASSCLSDPTRMHLAEGYCYVEAVRSDGTLCNPGELGNIIATSLHSWAMPVIRLEPGDVGRIIEDRCECGRRSRRLEHGGRLQALIKNSDGRWVTGADIWDRLLFVPGLSLFQLHQSSQKKYVLRLTTEPQKRIDMASLEEALHDVLGSKATVQFDHVSHLVTESSGKLQLVKSTTFEQFRAGASSQRQEVPIN